MPTRTQVAVVMLGAGEQFGDPERQRPAQEFQQADGQARRRPPAEAVVDEEERVDRRFSCQGVGVEPELAASLGDGPSVHRHGWSTMGVTASRRSDSQWAARAGDRSPASPTAMAVDRTASSGAFACGRP